MNKVKKISVAEFTILDEDGKEFKKEVSVQYATDEELEAKIYRIQDGFFKDGKTVLMTDVFPISIGSRFLAAFKVLFCLSILSILVFLAVFYSIYAATYWIAYSTICLIVKMLLKAPIFVFEFIIWIIKKLIKSNF